MVIGGVGAYLFHYKDHSLKLLRSKLAQMFAWGVIVLLFFNSFHILSIFDNEIVAVVTVILIINQVSNPKFLLSLENKIADYLGKISFGLYVYHPLIISIALLTFEKLQLDRQGLSAGFFVATVVVGSFLPAHLSFKYFESWFLKKKNKFAIIRSAGSARQIEVETKNQLVG